jgi:hypothetical protein
VGKHSRAELFPFEEEEGSVMIGMLAQLDPEEAERIAAKAAEFRKHLQEEQRRVALQLVYDEHFAGMDVQPAAREIAAALAGHRIALGDSEEARRRVALRPAIRKRVAELVAPFALPTISYHRVKQIIRKK